MDVRNQGMTKAEYEAALYRFMKQSEGDVARIYSDSDGIPTLGIGYALVTKSGDVYTLRDKNVIESTISTARGSAYQFSTDQWKLLEEVTLLLNNGFPDDAKNKIPVPIGNEIAGYYDVSKDRFNLNLDAGARKNLFTEVIKGYEKDLAVNDLTYSEERIAIMSLHYNIGNMPKTFEYIRDNTLVNQRVKVWYEIRYASNKSRDSKLENRRINEAATFGLFSSSDGLSPTGENEAMQVIRYLEQKRLYIISYTNDTGGSIAELDTYLEPAKRLLIDQYSNGLNIDGDVMVGQGIGDSGEEFADLNAASDTLTGTSLNDLIFGERGDDTLIGGGGNDNIYGGEDDDTLIGGGGNDNIYGGEDDDILDGGTGNDTMSGGQGNDTYYVDSLTDVIIEKAGEGDGDTLISSIDYTVTDQHKNIEQVGLDTRNGGSGIRLTGNALDNTLIGNQLDNILLGGDGADTLYGGEGDDRLEAGEEDIYGSGDINILQGGAGNDTLIGGDGIDLLYGGTGDDTLFVDRGGLYVSSWNQANYLGTEKMSGGEGFDTYYVGTSSNYATIEDSDGKGQIYAKASGIGDNTYKLKGGGFQLEQTTEQGLEADGYIQIHADGTVSNYTVAYELDGSQTLIAYGFNIPNFYNGMLGIKLEGGRVDTGNNIVDDVLDKIVFDEQFDPVDVERIKSAIKNAYEQSPIARKMLTDFAVIGDNAININFAENDFYTFVDGNNFYSSDSTAIGTNVTENAAAQQENSINIDLNWLTNNTYISTNGTAVEETLETALIHELTHLIKGFADTSNPGEKGETVTFANTIYREMGLAEQVSYLAYDPTGNTHVTNFEYTQGQAIDRAFTLYSESSVNLSLYLTCHQNEKLAA